MRIVGEFPPEMRACRARAGEHQGVDAAVQQGRACLPSALDDIDHALGQVRLGKSLGHQLADPGGLFRGFEDHGVTGQQGRDDMAVGQVAGEVEGPQHRRHAVRTVAQGGLAETGLGRALAGTFVIGADGDVDFARHGAKLGRGLPQGLAGLSGDGLGHGRGAGLQHRLIAFDRIDPVMPRAIRPVGEGGAGAIGSGLDLGTRGGGTFPDGFSGGGVDGFEMGHSVTHVFTRTMSPVFTRRTSAVSAVRVTISPSIDAR